MRKSENFTYCFLDVSGGQTTVYGTTPTPIAQPVGAVPVVTADQPPPSYESQMNDNSPAFNFNNFNPASPSATGNQHVDVTSGKNALSSIP